MARLPRDIQDALERLEPAIRDAFLRAIDQIVSAIRLQQLEDMIRAGNIEGAVESLRLEQGFFGPLYEAQRSSYLTGGAVIAMEVRPRNPYDGSRFEFSFNGRHDRAEAWIKRQSSRLITEIIEEQQEQARDIIREGLEAGTHPRSVARDIVGRTNPVTGKREGGLIGLTSVQMEWAKNAERELRALSPAYFRRDKRDKRFDGTVMKAIKSGKPLSEADIAKITNRYRDRLMKYRGDMIARTEALNGLRAGRHEGFRQMVEQGIVREDQVRIRWQATLDTRVRDTHRHMNGETIKMGEFFMPSPGVLLSYPGDQEHTTDQQALARETICCRCLAVYRIRSDLMRYDDE